MIMPQIIKELLSTDSYTTLKDCLKSRETCMVPIHDFAHLKSLDERKLVLSLFEEFAIHSKVTKVSDPFAVAHPLITSLLIINVDGPYILKSFDQQREIVQGQVLYVPASDGLKVIPLIENQSFILIEMIQTESTRLILYLMNNLNQVTFPNKLMEPLDSREFERLFESTRESLIDWLNDTSNISRFREKTFLDTTKGKAL